MKSRFSFGRAKSVVDSKGGVASTPASATASPIKDTSIQAARARAAAAAIPPATVHPYPAAPPPLKELRDMKDVEVQSPRKRLPSVELPSTDALVDEHEPPAAHSNIIVAVRCRPFVNDEATTEGDEPAWYCDDRANTITQILSDEVRNKDKNRRPFVFAFDYVFEDRSTEDIYEAVGERLVYSCMEGLNGTIFAYGQTNSGKTFTMKGVREEPGMIPLAVQDVFSFIEETPEREFLLRVSYLEIYNEVINDLFNPSASNLRIHEDAQKGVYVGGLKEHIVMTADNVMALLAAGEQHRHVGRTNYNMVSSRSHTVFSMIVESRPRAGSRPSTPMKRNVVNVSYLNLIDLAGSERIADSDIRRKEGGFINKSLLTLGTVISKLSEGNSTHIPYRDSKLTRILQNSLSGNANISVICTISPTYSCQEESASTCKFAQRAKKVVTAAQVNEIADEKALLKKYREEIKLLKNQLDELVRTGGVPDKEEVRLLEELKNKNRVMEEELKEKNTLAKRMEERIKQLTKMILTSSATSSKSKGAATGSSEKEERDQVVSELHASLKNAAHLRRENIRSSRRRTEKLFVDPNAPAASSALQDTLELTTTVDEEELDVTPSASPSLRRRRLENDEDDDIDLFVQLEAESATNTPMKPNNAKSMQAIDESETEQSAEMNRLKMLISKLEDSNSAKASQIALLNAAVEHETTEKTTLRQRNEHLQAECAAQAGRITELLAENARLTELLQIQPSTGLPLLTNGHGEAGIQKLDDLRPLSSSSSHTDSSYPHHSSV